MSKQNWFLLCLIMSNLGELIYALPKEVKLEIRRLEKCFLKLQRKELSCAFNRTCLNEDILPKYTHLKLHDMAATQEGFTKEFRKKLIQRQLEGGAIEVTKLIEENQKRRANITNLVQDIELRKKIFETIDRNAEKVRFQTHTNMLKKLQKLYGGPIFLPQNRKCFINLSKRKLSIEEEEFLNLGLNCHLYSKFDPYKKKVELEMLYNNLLTLQKADIIEINPNLKDQLRSESTKRRGKTNSSILTPKLKAAAKSLREDSTIVIRKADKSNMYVIMDRGEYDQKLREILSDESKFEKITRNPVDELKKKAYTIIKSVNQKCNKKLLKEPIGDFEPGYIYGNVKTHKPGNKLRPIISQVTTPTYKTAKELDEIIKPYIPAKYMLKSRDEFINILKTTKPKNAPSSLDVESLFTNVPVRETIKIILENVYNHETLPPPAIPAADLEELLLLCTTSVPFRGVDGNMYVQKDGMSMGSPLGPTFANFYMAHHENKVLSLPNMSPNIYCRYVDDIFTDADEELLLKIKRAMEEQSVLKFTYELANGGQLPFLDILTMYTSENYLTTEVYTKPTDNGICLNGKSECPDRYKETVILSYVKRAWTTSSSFTSFQGELSRVKQMLVNNSYSNKTIDKVIKGFMDKVSIKEVKNTDNSKIDVYYQNQMNTEYKTDEKVLKKILRDNVISKKENDKLNVIMYYSNTKSKSLVMKNNLYRKKSRPIDQKNVIYKFKCPKDECIRQQLVNNVYIGYTTCTLSRRLSMHLQNGAIKVHYENTHNEKIDRDTIVQCTKIEHRENDTIRLEIREALLILNEKPDINKQDTGKKRILSLFQ